MVALETEKNFDNVEVTVKNGFVTAVIDSGIVIRENEDEIVIPVTITRECVLQYDIGKAYRPADELKNSAFTFEGTWITLGAHPPHVAVSDPVQVDGRLWNVKYDADAVDPDGFKSPRLVGEAHISKKPLHPDGVVNEKLIADIRAGKLRDVSIGYTTHWYRQSGEWNGKHYDWVQRRLMGTHVAVGLPVGRQRFPYIGVACDAENVSALSAEELQEHIAKLKNERDSVQAEYNGLACGLISKIDEVDAEKAKLKQQIYADFIKKVEAMPERIQILDGELQTFLAFEAEKNKQTALTSNVDVSTGNVEKKVVDSLPVDASDVVERVVKVTAVKADGGNPELMKTFNLLNLNKV